MDKGKRLIDAYTLAEEIESLTVTVAGKPAKWNDAKHSVLRILAEQPDVEAVEVVHGRWIHGTTMHRDWMKCSECLHSQIPDGTFVYCPNCGAKMDGGDAE